MKIAVSACLLGQNCKYNGGNNFSQPLAEFLQGHTVLPICPEVLVFPTPRPRIERFGALVLDENGWDVSALCREGVARCVASLEGQGVDLVILQSRSPTCGVKEIYDGTFSGVRIAGQGLLAEALSARGYRVMDVEDVPWKINS